MNQTEQANRATRFLNAWKKGIKKVGEEYFELKCTVDEATDKWQLCPDALFVLQVTGRISHGEAVLLGLMVNFYNANDGQAILTKSNASNLVDALAVLDDEGRHIVGELWLSYDGW